MSHGRLTQMQERLLALARLTPGEPRAIMNLAAGLLAGPGIVASPVWQSRSRWSK